MAKEIKKFRIEGRKSVFQAISRLSENPRPPGSVKLKVQDLGEYRLRAGAYRVRYDVDDENREVHILAVKPRDRAYRV
ncbi:MAG: type II toxin-antitoxin system RelE/ParE family toxin [Actinobacteria bacterium]|nr:type II toxin-antitoxin system RelE/ParE family toxin [Actinomycetota bacterium]MBU1943098.1 type II toxin-antitoxin system RelE/ParE family toxin [Actinomycetota bacterium]MBU2687955.1 type II toxin-antitoxin system RelE/ParE family toxin [Actinomycetota bacterium]